MKTILHLYADTGSDSWFYRDEYEVILIGSDIGVENYVPDSDMEFRSLCSQKFAKAFFEVNK